MNAIIIEDESLIARQLASKIKEIAPDIKILEMIPSLKVARRWLSENAEPDLMFMDIQLSDGVSFEIFEQFQLTCPVIFVTAFDEYAIRAFKVNGIDYLLKPVEDADLAKAIEKCRRFTSSAESAPPNNWQEVLQSISRNPGKPLYKEKFIINLRNQWVPVQTRDIACINRENINYLFTFDGTKYIMDTAPLDEIEELLDPNIFFRANRQSIININAIQSVKPHENSKLTVYLKAPLKIEQDISRDKAPVFRKWFDR
jgi:DNA-binding LytR/AlgR family response regulator